MTRPFRHLCPEADLRDAMSDGEFWDHVASNLLGASGQEDDEPDADELRGEIEFHEPCPTCGAPGACGYDDEGRPMIHASMPDDE